VIPRADIVEWRAFAPWKNDAQVEQDLILSRLIVELFRDPLIRIGLLFRGGTALHKLFLPPAARYSEDLDLVQRTASPIGPVISAIRSIGDALLGKPKIRQKEDSVILLFRTNSEIPPVVPLRVKVEINTREHFSAFPTIHKPFSVQSRWFSGEALVQTYSLEELLATKLRALYQRKKGRDLFDIWYGVTEGKADPKKIVLGFARYLEAGNLMISIGQMRNNLQLKIKEIGFLRDIEPLVRTEIPFSPEDAYALVDETILAYLE
jgi:predicted nucleotidyltransferase component of viral defense system